MRRGAEFEALWAVEIDGGLYLVDGWQRYEAAKRVGRGEFPVRVWFGTWEEAVEFAAQCNAQHGRPRTRADLTKTIAMLRTLPQWRNASAVAIAKDNTERYNERIDKYPRRALKKLKEDYASLPAAEQAEFWASQGKMSVDHILARSEDLYDSQLATIAMNVLRRIRSKEYDPQLATICIEVFNKIGSDKEKLRVDEVVAGWSNEHTEGDALEEETDTHESA
jgi:hypothetical protein